MILYWDWRGLAVNIYGLIWELEQMGAYGIILGCFCVDFSTQLNVELTHKLKNTRSPAYELQQVLKRIVEMPQLISAYICVRYGL